jgi:hypothetical protein
VTSTSIWEARRGRIITRKGGWRIGQGISVAGFSLLDDLVGKHSFFELLFLEITDRLPPPAFARWIEACFMCLSFPDPRIWCNQIGALGGAMRCTPSAAVTAGTLASDSHLYGPGAAHIACEFIAAATQEAQAGASIADIIARRTARGGRLRAPGYSRPVASGDDRVDALRKLAEQVGLPEGDHLRTAWKLDEHLRTNRGDNSLNMLGYVTAAMLDNGIGSEDTYRIFTLIVNAGVHACYCEAADEPAGTFLPLRVDDIEYIGTPARTLPVRS